MRILTDNVLSRSTVTSENESFNYLAQNLVHDFLRKKWQATAGTANDITFALTGTESLNCLFIGYWNVDSIDIDLKIATVSQYSTNFVPTYSTDCVYFDQTYTGIDEVVITANLSSGTMYIGGLAGGVYTEFPLFDFNPLPNFIDNSTTIDSDGGQSLQNKFDALEQMSLNWNGITKAQWDIIKSEYFTAGKGGKLWVDYYHELHSYKRPDYAKWSSFTPKPVAPDGSYSFSSVFTEVR